MEEPAPNQEDRQINPFAQRLYEVRMHRKSVWRPQGETQELLSKVNELLEGERRGVRDLYYALKARGEHYDYGKIKYVLKKGRLHGLIDPTRVIDQRRGLVSVPSGDKSVAQSLKDLRLLVQYKVKYYDRDFWEDQPIYLEVWVEKEGLIPFFEGICREYNVTLMPCAGDLSITAIYKASLRFQEQLDKGKRCKVLYFGDFNPSGLHAPVAIQETMEFFGLNQRRKDEEEHYFEINMMGAEIKFERVALTIEQIDEFDFPPNPAPSKTDKDRTLKERFMRYVTGGRDLNIELNAMKEFERDYFEELIRKSIEENIDLGLQESFLTKVEKEREELAERLPIELGQVLDELRGNGQEGVR